jgi:hypothetical protein
MSTYTLIHVAITLIGIASGFVVMKGLLGADRMPGWTAVFLTFTVLTSLTGFGFAFERVLPSHIFAVLSLVVLLFAILAYYQFRLAGPWRWIYVVTALTAQWLNVFVLVVQLFNRVPTLNALAPTQSEPPFLIAQVVVLAAFIAFGVAAVRKFHPPATA